MNPYTIDVRQVEELQMISNREELERMFERAKHTIVNGESVFLSRSDAAGRCQPFDELTTLDDLTRYRKEVLKYL